MLALRLDSFPDLGVDGAHRLHVGLPPLSSQVFRLHLQQLENVQLQGHGAGQQVKDSALHLTCSMACFTFSVLFSIGADLNTTSI